MSRLFIRGLLQNHWLVLSPEEYAAVEQHVEMDVPF
jgi:hypothetical protein